MVRGDGPQNVSADGVGAVAGEGASDGQFNRSGGSIATGNDMASTSDGSDAATCSGDCDDGVFCNGAEVCAPSDPDADAAGCIPGVLQCLGGQFCDAAEDVCVSDCGANRDADGDGFDAVVCGGTDCEDANATINPDGIEQCNGLDDDCNGAVDDGFFGPVSCLVPNAQADCVAGACEISSCIAGFADCDGDPLTGCEHDVDLVSGDCSEVDCNGNMVVQDLDTPSDPTECNLGVCNDGIVGYQMLPNDTPCGQGECFGGVCLD